MCDLEPEEKEKILRLLESIKRGRWKLKQFNSGKTNKNFLCVNDDKRVVARVFGRNTGDFINRNQERSNISQLHTYGLAPRVFATFDNGFIIDYIPGRELEEEELVNYYELIARKLKKWHDVKCFGVPMAFKNLLDWYWKAHVHHEKILEKYKIYEFIINYEKLVKQCHTGFCHNDLLASNIILLSDSSASGEINITLDSMADADHEISDVEFIDYEYSGLNYIAFDLANHFAEYIGFSYDKSRLPTDEFQKEFIRTYLYDGYAVNDALVNDLLKEVKLFMPVVHCYWGLWALLKSENQDKDFDYLKYADFKLSMVEDKIEEDDG